MSKKPEVHFTFKLVNSNLERIRRLFKKFIALRMEARGDGPFFLEPTFTSSLIDSTYDWKTQQDATLTSQERQGGVQLKAC